jgi:hypothetical protein
VTTEGGPQAEDHSARLKKGDFLIGLLSAAPSHSFVEAPCLGQIGNAESHHGDPLFHRTQVCQRQDSADRRTLYLRPVSLDAINADQ